MKEKDTDHKTNVPAVDGFERVEGTTGLYQGKTKGAYEEINAPEAMVQRMLGQVSPTARALIETKLFSHGRKKSTSDPRT